MSSGSRSIKAACSGTQQFETGDHSGVVTGRTDTTDTISAPDAQEASRTFVREAKGAADRMSQCNQVRKLPLDVARKTDPDQFPSESCAVSTAFDVDHLMTKQGEKFLERPVLKEPADPDQLLVRMTGSPGADHPDGPLTAVFRQRSVPVFPVQMLEQDLKIIFRDWLGFGKKLQLHLPSFSHRP